MRLQLFAVAILMVSAGCRGDRLSSVDAVISAAPAPLDFGAVWVGHEAVRELRVENRSRTVTEVKLSVGAPFRVDAETLRIPAGGTAAAGVRVTLDAPGSARATLAISGEHATLEIEVRAEAAVAPTCVAAGPCEVAAFDPASGTCNHQPMADGERCVSGSACVTNARCLAGACVGEALDCSDGNACTQDACDAAGGCIHVGQSPEDTCGVPADPCKVPFCDPLTGCGVADAADGTSCGDADCVSASVCMSGACKVVPVPEGAACGTPSPCQAPGRCEQQVCVRPVPGQLVPRWEYVPPAGTTLGFDGVADSQQNLYWAEWNGNDCDGPGCSAAMTVSATRDGLIRWRAPVNTGASGTPDDIVYGQLVSGSVLVSWVGNHSVIAQRTTDGAQLWHRDLRTDHSGVLYDPAVPQIRRHLAFGTPGVDGAGRLIVPIDGWRSTPNLMVHEGSIVVAVDLQTGATAWVRQLQGRYGRIVSDEAGNAYLSIEDLDESQQPAISHAAHALTSGGQSKWTTALSQSAYPAVAGGTIVTGGVEAIDSSNGSLLWSSGGSTVAPGLIQGNSAWGFRWSPGMGAFDLVRRNLRTGLAQWTVQMPQTQWASDANLTSRGEVLFLRSNGDFVGTYELVKVDANGQQSWACSLPPPEYYMNVALLDGRVVMKRVASGSSLVAFDVPNERLATSGWATRGANLGRDQRAR